MIFINHGQKIILYSSFLDFVVSFPLAWYLDSWVMKQQCGACVYPSSWRVHSLTPLHKKGDTSKPANYRGIAVGCCLSKVFLGVLHNRLLEFVDKHKLIPNCQIGYKHGSRTSDHILTLKNLIDKYIPKGKYMFACFVDYKSAFDTMWRKGLFFKLLRHGIGCNFLPLSRVYTVKFITMLNWTLVCLQQYHQPMELSRDVC